jgi:hypothetical protein
MNVVIFMLIWIFAALVAAALWHALVGGNNNYPKQ